MNSRQFTTRNVKKRQTKRLVKLSIFIAIVIIGVVITGFALLNKTVKGSVFTSSTDLPFYKESQYVTNSKLIAYHKDSTIKAIDHKANEQFSISDVSNDAQIRISENNIAYFTNNLYFVYDLKGKLVCKLETGDEIQDIRLGESYVVFLKKNTEGTYKLVLNSFSGEELYTLDIEDITELVDFGVISSSQTIWTLNCDTKILTHLSILTTYNTKKNSLSNVINIAEQLIDKLYINSDKIYGVGTNNLVIYNINGEKQESYLVYGWKLSDHQFVGGKPTFVFTPRLDGTAKFNSVRIRHSDASEYTFTLQEECLKVIIGKNNVYSFNENSVFYTDLKGNNIKKSPLPFNITDAHSVLGGSHVMVDNGNKYSLFQLN